jgi:hypothetical protein
MANKAIQNAHIFEEILIGLSNLDKLDHDTVELVGLAFGGSPIDPTEFLMTVDERGYDVMQLVLEYMRSVELEKLTTDYNTGCTRLVEYNEAVIRLFYEVSNVVFAWDVDLERDEDE